MAVFTGIQKDGLQDRSNRCPVLTIVHTEGGIPVKVSQKFISNLSDSGGAEHLIANRFLLS